VQSTLGFERYATEMCIKEEFLFCELLLATTKAADMFQLIDEFFSKNGLNWKTKLGFICTDGAPSMLGKKSGFGALVQVEAPQVVVIQFSTPSCIGFKNSFSKTEISHGYCCSSSELHPVSIFEPQTLQNILPRSWSCS
jgi:hypothetical protein